MPSRTRLTVYEFSTGDGLDRTHFVLSGDLLLSLAKPCEVIPDGTAAAVAVLLGVDGDHDEVHLEVKNGEEPEILTRAAEGILRVRDQLLTIHGYADYEAYAASRPQAVNR